SFREERDESFSPGLIDQVQVRFRQPTSEKNWYAWIRVFMVEPWLGAEFDAVFKIPANQLSIPHRQAMAQGLTRAAHEAVEKQSQKLRLAAYQLMHIGQGWREQRRRNK